MGINTDKPEEALSVHGNIQVMGQILQASDTRIKRDIRKVSDEVISLVESDPDQTVLHSLQNPWQRRSGVMLSRSRKSQTCMIRMN